MPHSSSDWHGTSILSAIPKHIVAPRKQRPSDTTIPIIPMSPSPSYYSLGNQRKPAKTVGLHTFKGVVLPPLQQPQEGHGLPPRANHLGRTPEGDGESQQGFRASRAASQRSICIAGL